MPEIFRESLFHIIKMKLLSGLLWNSLLVIFISPAISYGQLDASKEKAWKDLLQQYHSGKINDTLYLNAAQGLVEQSFRDTALLQKLETYRQIAWNQSSYQPYRVKYYAFLSNNAYYIHREGTTIYYMQRMEDELKKVEPYLNSLNEPRYLLGIYSLTNGSENRRMAELEKVWPVLIGLPAAMRKVGAPPVTCVNAMTILSNAAEFYTEKKDTARVKSILSIAEAILDLITNKYPLDQGKMQQCLYWTRKIRYNEKKLLNQTAIAKKILDTIYADISAANAKSNPGWRALAERVTLLKLSGYFSDLHQYDSAEYYLQLLNKRQLENKQDAGDRSSFLFNYGKLKAATGNYKEAYENILGAYNTSDSIAGLKTIDIANNMYAQSEAEDERRKLDAAEAQKKQRNITITIVAAALLIFIGFLFLQIRRKEHAARDRIDKLNYASQLQIMELEEKNRLVKQEEQKRLGMDLHDNLAGTLAAIKVKLESELVDNNDTEQVKRLGQISNLVTDMYNNARNKSHELYTGTNDEPEILFSKRVKMIANNGLSLNKYKMEIEIDDIAMKNIPLKIKIELLYIIREAITNIIRHAAASRISIFMYEDLPGLILHIEDDGRGFDKKLKKKGIGLQTIRERAARINGSFEIAASTNGTEIKIIAPVTGAMEAGDV